jgi:hypothetical protein
VGAYFDGFFFFFLQWAILLAYLQKHYEISPPQVKITFFTLFYQNT